MARHDIGTTEFAIDSHLMNELRDSSVNSLRKSGGNLGEVSPFAHLARFPCRGKIHLSSQSCTTFPEQHACGARRARERMNRLLLRSIFAVFVPVAVTSLRYDCGCGVASCIHEGDLVETMPPSLFTLFFSQPAV